MTEQVAANRELAQRVVLRIAHGEPDPLPQVERGSPRQIRTPLPNRLHHRHRQRRLCPRSPPLNRKPAFNRGGNSNATSTRIAPGWPGVCFGVLISSMHSDVGTSRVGPDSRGREG
jgi:hypothetical protein